MDTHYANIVLDSVGSTQDEAAARFSGSPLLVVAAHQAEGRGRLNRAWVQADRAMFSSLVYTPSAVHRGLIPLVAGLAVREALATTFGVEAGLRWPNDLVVGSDKVGGILVEADDERAIVGCGVNLWWSDPMPGAAGVVPTDPGPDAASMLAAAWVGNFLDRGEAAPWDREEYRAASVTIGRHVAYARGTGIAFDIAPDGALLVDTGDGIIAIHGGEVRLHDPTTLSGAAESGESP
ncbi:MAG: biotin--[acetyl-CoA-carboxylase] ligase [Acidimicrobiia bacterium]|nr:MAG: biotin--[acetyl-CoA-carboxylase] ligase [Acidimicrobiia bacterium]